MNLLIRQGDGAPRAFSFDGQVTIGRDESAGLQLPDGGVSRSHATFKDQGSGCAIMDHGSTNGTYVDGERIPANVVVTVVPGQSISIGPFFVELLPDPPALPTQTETASGGAATLVHVEAIPTENRLFRKHVIEALGEIPVWDGSATDLLVTDVIRESHDVNTFRMVSEEPMLFRFLPGQFLGLTLEIDGQTVKRSYSISSSPSRPMALEMTVKRIPGGLVSNWLAENVRPGHRLKVKGPMGKFSCLLKPAEKILMLGAGSGVTPLMSMLRWIVDTSSPVDVVLLYSVRSPEDLVFGRELETIAARHENIRVAVTVTNSRMSQYGWTGLSQRVDRSLLTAIVPDAAEREVFMCGPKPFADAMKAELAAVGLPDGKLHQESFGSGKGPGPKPMTPEPQAAPAAPVVPPPPVASAPVAEAPAPAGVPEAPVAAPVLISDLAPLADAPPVPALGSAAPGCLVQFAKSGVKGTPAADQTLLEWAEDQGLELDYSCRAGDCGTCITRKLSGEVEMADHGLTDDELQQGLIYICVAKAKSDVVLDA
jgi:ferredoxin-NADP reductase/ferredoxin